MNTATTTTPYADSYTFSTSPVAMEEEVVTAHGGECFSLSVSDDACFKISSSEGECFKIANDEDGYDQPYQSLIDLKPLGFDKIKAVLCQNFTTLIVSGKYRSSPELTAVWVLAEINFVPNIENNSIYKIDKVLRTINLETYETVQNLDSSAHHYLLAYNNTEVNDMYFRSGGGSSKNMIIDGVTFTLKYDTDDVNLTYTGWWVGQTTMRGTLNAPTISCDGGGTSANYQWDEVHPDGFVVDESSIPLFAYAPKISLEHNYAGKARLAVSSVLYSDLGLVVVGPIYNDLAPSDFMITTGAEIQRVSDDRPSSDTYDYLCQDVYMRPGKGIGSEYTGGKITYAQDGLIVEPNHCSFDGKYILVGDFGQFTIIDASIVHSSSSQAEYESSKKEYLAFQSLSWAEGGYTLMFGNLLFAQEDGLILQQSIDKIFETK